MSSSLIMSVYESEDLPPECEELHETADGLIERAGKSAVIAMTRKSANCWVDFCRQSLTIRLVKDRSQYHVEGACETLSTLAHGEYVQTCENRMG
jgi:hypothetical protein